MTSDISCLISLLGSIWPWLSLWPHFLSSSLHANHTGLLAIPQTCQGSTLSPKDLHICFSPLEHSSRSCHGFCTYFLEVFAQVSPLYRSLSWTPLLSHHHSIQFSLPFFLFFFLLVQRTYHHLASISFWLLTLEWKPQESKDSLVSTFVAQALRTVHVTQ